MNIEDLGRRAVACAHWRWMPGMLLLPHIDGCECCEDRNFPRRAARIPAVFTTDIDVVDLSDPATMGCLLALVREAWGDATADVIHFDVWKTNGTWGHEWTVQCRDAGRFTKSRGATEAEALVAALEAAP